MAGNNLSQLTPAQQAAMKAAMQAAQQQHLQQMGASLGQLAPTPGSAWPSPSLTRITPVMAKPTIEEQVVSYVAISVGALMWFTILLSFICIPSMVLGFTTCVLYLAATAGVAEFFRRRMAKERLLAYTAEVMANS